MEENDKYWQNLWQENCELQFEKEYESFVTRFSLADIEHQKRVMETLRAKAKETQNKEKGKNYFNIENSELNLCS